MGWLDAKGLEGLWDKIVSLVRLVTGDVDVKNKGNLQTQINNVSKNFVKSGTGAKAGLVPSPGTTAGTTKYLREDGTWAVPHNNMTKLNETDTREVNSPPSYYMEAARAKGIVTEFKRGSVIGFTGDEYVQLTTFCQWSDKSGGFPAQIATGHSNGMYYRRGTSADAWSAWARLTSPTRVKGDAETSYREGDVNLTPANIGALALTGGTLTGAINGITLKSISVPDNGGKPKYLLLFDVTTWYNSTTVYQVSRIFTGIVFASRTGGYMGESIEKVYAGVSYEKKTAEDGAAVILRTTSTLYIPCIIKNNTDSKYYLALRVAGSGRSGTLMGRMTSGYIGTWVNGSDSDWTIPGYTVAMNDYKTLGAIKATQDSDGKVIKDTYVKKTDVTQSAAVTVPGQKALDAVEKNAAVAGTLAHQIAQVNSGLEAMYLLDIFISANNCYASFGVVRKIKNSYSCTLKIGTQDIVNQSGVRFRLGKLPITPNNESFGFCIIRSGGIFRGVGEVIIDTSGNIYLLADYSGGYLVIDGVIAFLT